jgi:serine/threonine protein kinase
MVTPSNDATLRIASGSSPAPGGVQFAPGSIVANRYRIVSLLGSGGMGEVYRADDVKLEQPVALKFLPPALARDPVLLARLHDEVRLGRQVSHPNVCRIYDIGEAGDAHFVAMDTSTAKTSRGCCIASAASRPTRPSSSHTASPRDSRPRTRRASSTAI